jgi:hypothetical protein
MEGCIVAMLFSKHLETKSGQQRRVRHFDRETGKQRDESPNVCMPGEPSPGKLGAFCGVVAKDKKRCKNNDLMVVDAVFCEPVSAHNSLLTPEKQGKSAK